jgi:hypothetical protein
VTKASPSPVVSLFDPPIRQGSYEALRRTDGKIAILDTRKPMGQRTIRLVMSEGAARAVVAELVAQEWMENRSKQT